MDYGKLFSRAWDLIWKHKFLIVLGILVALGGAGGGSGGTSGFSGGEGDFNVRNLPRFDFNFSAPLRNLDLPAFAVGGILILVVLAVMIALVVWVVGLISRGGLIYGANAVSTGQEATFMDSLRAGWGKGWRLVGIGLVPAIPVLLLMVSAFFSAGFYISGRTIAREGQFFNLPGFVIPVIAITCLLVLLALLLSLLRTFANRACMLEDRGVIDSYRRGFEVLGDHFGQVLVLFLLQIVISLGIWFVLLLPSILIALCCFLWPLLIVIQGTFAAFYSTLWTLAWNQWTGHKEEQNKEAVPVS
jgi:hypothetical protein